ncbi:MAG: 5-formyltetrahydrofolate cyclo-ligase, partial [Gammaproteobacteria bacterium]
MAKADDKGRDPDNDDCDEPVYQYSSPPCYRHELDPGYFDPVAPVSMGWPAVSAWRREQRQRLRDLRDRMSRSERARADRVILEALDWAQAFGAVDCGVYWPLPGEFDSRRLMEQILDAGGGVAIPVIVGRDAPLEFWRWNRHTAMRAQGPWNIPAPAERHILNPTTLIIPLLGFDADCHRLGHGGGYFDRTLAALEPRP